ncbi:MAG TPA: BrnT family toxin [Terriglobia bacterium]|nr:BrnT family toxin [Terriglobia bacterium]
MKNHRKHGVPFEEASTIFSDPEAFDWEDLENAATERRWKPLGLSRQGRALLVSTP